MYMTYHDLGSEEKASATGQKAQESLREVLAELRRTDTPAAYHLRPLKDGDLFPMLRILKKAGLKDIKDAFIHDFRGKSEIDAVDVKGIGIDTALKMADILIGKLDLLEDDLYTLWADISGVPADQIREMEFGTLPLMIMETFSNAGNASFFKVLSRLL